MPLQKQIPAPDLKEKCDANPPGCARRVRRHVSGKAARDLGMGVGSGLRLVDGRNRNSDLAHLGDGHYRPGSTDVRRRPHDVPVDQTGSGKPSGEVTFTRTQAHVIYAFCATTFIFLSLCFAYLDVRW